MTTKTEFLLALESFDCIKVEGMKHVENHCRKFNMGLVQYSPEVNLWCKRRNLWQLVLRRQQGHPIKATYINRLAKSCQVLNPLGATPFEATRALQAATTRYLTLKPKHELLRSDFLWSHLHDPSLCEEHHKAISRLISLETLRDTYCHIRALHQHSAGHSISAVEYSSPSGPVLASAHSAVETALSSALQTRFTRAHGSPFLHDPFALLVGPFGMGLAATAILEGTFQCPPGVDNFTQKFITALQFPSLAAHRSQVSSLLRPEDFIAHWRRVKE